MSDGVVYVVFGKQAQALCAKSLASLRKYNPDLPVVVVGDMPMYKYHVRRIPWKKDTAAYNAKRSKRFRFESGIVKPALFDISPFDNTLYLDVDTEIRGDITQGFDFLDFGDFAIAPHNHTVEWYIPSRSTKKSKREYAETCAEFGIGAELYWNSGVFFWRKNECTKELFRLWHEEWERYKPWNEQLSLMRASQRVENCEVMFIERQIWNTNQPDERTKIFHDYGKGTASKK